MSGGIPRGCVVAVLGGLLLAVIAAVGLYAFRLDIAARLMETGNVRMWRAAIEKSDLTPAEREEGARLGDALVAAVREGRIRGGAVEAVRGLDKRLQAAVRGDRFDAEALRGVMADLRRLVAEAR